ncbi:MAG: UTP--glucose-1-phosphate uridylyltransferase GalU [Mycoplasmataceae bacterium]|jgi:UTP--glucose-1-phosphate uridylyltransferase|nr:UTP--glucose-1-phosphate uridylyltransferase GalU [Mycoplasmataceae bacterium]
MIKTKPIKKAIITAAGLGTRFLPATKALPKEMLPIVNIPTIQYVFDECVASGITDICIIISQDKAAIINHFDHNFKLEHALKAKNKIKEYNLIHRIGEHANIFYIRQKQAIGLGDAVLRAETFINNEPFVVVLGDDIVINDGQEKPALLQCIKAYEQTNSSIVGVQSVPNSQIEKYGIVVPTKNISQSITKIGGAVEKPQPDKAPSNLAILGRYVFKPEIFEHLKRVKKDKSGEIQLTSAINTLAKKQGVCACNFTGKRYDIGSPNGYVIATIDMSLKNEKIKKNIVAHIKSLKI